MKFREIAAKLFYKDAANVQRAVLTAVGSTDDYIEQEVIVGMPCRLSVSHERPTEHRDDVSMKQTYHYVLFHAPEYELLPNDVIQVTLRGGDEITLFAGNSFYYEIGQVETQVRRRKEAGQN